jgi:hypothetical protein
MKLRRLFVGVASAAALSWTGAGEAAPGATLCVDTAKPGCFATVQAAVNAASDGDTIEIAPGTYGGGITITKSVDLVGASAAATTISGGGPVLTIGDGVAKPTVTISRMTVTGGFNDSVPDTSFPGGGGVRIPPAGGGTGATVTISDSIITGNWVTPGTTLPASVCGHVCAFANGGGIDNGGTLTVVDTRITDNVAGSTANDSSLASDANGGGIHIDSIGTLLLQHSAVTANRAAVNAPNGRFSNGGGIVDDGALTMEGSIVNGNDSISATDVPSVFPFDVEQEANAGGIWISEVPGSSATISDSTISDNLVAGSNAGGDVQATNGGIDDDGSLLLRDSTIDHKQVNASAPPSSGHLAGAVDGGLQVQGVATIQTSSISDNSLVAVSNTGPANAAGAGIGNLSGQLTLDHARITNNHGSATGTGGLLLGGGILNVAFGGGPPQLTISDSVITGNRLAGSPGLTPLGGGVFSADIFTGDPVPFTLTRTVIEGNQPDQCFGGC